MPYKIPSLQLNVDSKVDVSVFDGTKKIHQDQQLQSDSSSAREALALLAKLSGSSTNGGDTLHTSAISEAFEQYSFTISGSSMSMGSGGVSDEPVMWEVSAGSGMATYHIYVVRVGTFIDFVR